MAIENVKAFYNELEANEELQKKIAAADAAYNGDTGDKKAAVEAIVLPIAKETGFDFTAEEMLEAETAVNSEGEFTEDELEAVAGGFALCIVIGFGRNLDDDYSSDPNFAYCKYVGFGVGIGF